MHKWLTNLFYTTDHTPIRSLALSEIARLREEAIHDTVKDRCSELYNYCITLPESNLYDISKYLPLSASDDDWKTEVLRNIMCSMPILEINANNITNGGIKTRRWFKPKSNNAKVIATIEKQFDDMW